MGLDVEYNSFFNVFEVLSEEHLCEQYNNHYELELCGRSASYHPHLSSKSNEFDTVVKHAAIASFSPHFHRIQELSD